MSNLGAVFNIGRTALSTQRYGLDVTAQNIANVNTTGYSRQSAVFEPAQPVCSGNLILGQGVDATQVIRTTDRFIEAQLMQQRSKMSYSEEMENYMQVLEGVFNENLETSVSSMMSDFWNLWHDISNNPSGVSERTALYEHSVLLSERFNSLDDALVNLETDLTRSLSAEIVGVNRIANEIAQLNEKIVELEAGGNIANDLRDSRNTLLSELSEYLDVNSFDQSDGTLTVVTARGCVLVQGNSSYGLEMGGDNGDRVEWQSSGGMSVDITDYINNGKLGGWLTMRDEIIAEYKMDLSSLAGEFVWAVNSQHCQGVGLEAFSTYTGSFKVEDSAEELGTQASGLSFYNKISDGTFKLWVYDSDGNVVGGGATEISIDADPGGTSLDSLSSDIAAVAHLNTGITTEGKLSIDADTGYTFAFSDDTGNVLAALGVNAFFKGAGAGSIDVIDTIGFDKGSIAASRIDATGSYVSGDNSNALAIADLQYTSLDIPQWTCDRVTGNSEGNLNATIENYYHALVGSVGTTGSSISSGLAISEAMVTRLSVVRDSISAVSLDEEMTNLIKYQSAYEAASKLISTADEMLETLLDIK